MNHRGHAAHFLTRVDRLNAEHAELALGLYRDHELVKYLMHLLHVPTDTPRVALALDDTPKAPHVIVTREGRFVTCLGKGMRVKDATIVNRRSLDEVSDRAEALRKVVASAQSGGTKERDRHLRRLRKARALLTREEFEHLLEWSPLLFADYLKRALETSAYLEKALGYLKTVPRVGARHEALLRTYCERSWEFQHLAMLLAADHRGLQHAFERVDRKAGTDSLHRTWLIHELLATCNWAGMFRAAVAAASMAELIVPTLFKELERNEVSAEQQICSLTALHATLLRCPDLESQVLPVYERYLKRKGDAGTLFVASWAQLLEGVWRTQAQGLLDPVAADFVDKLTDMEPRTPQQVARMKGLVSTSKRALYTLLPLPFQFGNKLLTSQLLCMFDVCTMSPSDMYLPFKDRVRTAWKPDEGMLWLQPRLDPVLRPKRLPAVKEARPARNDPCPCSSGKKYKRCCGAN